MTCTVGESLIVLLPDRYQSDPFSPWHDMMTSNTKSIEITFSKKRCIGYVAVIEKILNWHMYKTGCITPIMLLVLVITIMGAFLNLHVSKDIGK